MTEDEKNRLKFLETVVQYYEWQKQVMDQSVQLNNKSEYRYCSRCVLKVRPFGFKEDTFWCPNCHRWMSNKPSRQFTKNDEKFLKDYGIKL